MPLAILARAYLSSIFTSAAYAHFEASIFSFNSLRLRLLKQTLAL
jgi:hypothetical protein